MPKPDDWQRVKELFEAARQLPAGERSEFLATACADENERREVETLLAAYESQFLEQPAIGNVAEMIVNRTGNELALADHVTRWRMMRLRLRFVLVGLFFAITTVAVGANSYLTLTSQMFFNPGDNGFAVKQQVGHFVVYLVDQNGPAGSLQIGDEFVSVDGENIRYQTDLIKVLRRHLSESSYSVVVRRNGQLLQLTLHRNNPSFSYYLPRLIYVLVSVTFLVMGLLVFLLKPDDKAALLLGLWFAAIGDVFPAELFMLLPVWLMWVVVVAFILRGLLSPLCLHFFLIFPEQSPLLRRFPRLELYVYLPYLLIILPYWAIYSVWCATSPDHVVAIQGFPLFSTLVLNLTYFAAGIASLVVGYRRASLPSRRKVRVIVAATIAGFLPPFVWLAVTVPNGPPRIAGWMSFLAPAVMASMMLVPPAYAYAILRHRVIPISLIIRRGVQYLFAKNVLRLLIALPILGLIVTVIANPDRTLSQILFRNSLYFYLTLMATAAIIFLFHKRLNNWIDRKFFREQYNQEQILSGLIEEVKKFDSVPEMSRLVSRKVESALHPEQIYLFYRGEESRDLSLGYSSEGASQGLRIPEEFRILRVMEGQPGAHDFPFPQKNILPGIEEEWLTALGTRLIVPLNGTDNRLAGLFLLGDKKSEVPYTRSDRNLLEAVAGQVALVYENAHLKERMDRERKIKHEVLGRFEERRINLLKECEQCGTCFDSSVLTCDQDGSELTFSMPVERTVEGRYRLERLVGRGGMGAVYESTDLRLNRRVGLKILSSKMFGNREALRRFEREAQASARLSHSNIVSVHDYGVLATGGAYLVMELISGETLAAMIKRERRVPPQTAAECFNQMLEGIKAAHAAGVIHRDLKPDNVLISKGENDRLHVRVLDFGLAKITMSALPDTNSSTALLTTPGTLMGTMGYMSPEQLTGKPADECSDLFAVGVMVVEAVTGQRPFNGSTYTELLNSILHGSFHLDGSKESERLDEVLQRCLAKDRECRFASAEQLQTELIPAIREYRSPGRQN